MTKSNITKPLIGVDYYAEFWPEERWSTDAKLMREAKLSIVRLAEFTWTKTEPYKDQYNWSWLDKLIKIFAAEDLKVLLGTPTAIPPNWLVQDHPDILPVDMQGCRRNLGTRRHYCSNNPNYQKATQRIVRAMGEHFRHYPNLIGWQIDNEFGCHETARCYCKNCVTAFRIWLQKKYSSLDELNVAWGTIFWNQLYSNWSQIMPPNLTITNANPSHVLDWYRFSSDSVVAYQKIQIDILRQLCPDKFITTDFMGTFTDLDYYKMAEQLDFITWNNFPTAGVATAGAQTIYMPGESLPNVAYDVGDPFITSFCHDQMRGLKNGKPFWVMEQQTGNLMFGNTNPTIRPGTVRLWTWHDLAAGVDVVACFHWRPSRFGWEQYYSGLLRHDGTFDIGYQDILKLKSEQPLMRSIQGTHVVAEIAILADYNDLWALDYQPLNKIVTYWRHLFAYHKALKYAGVQSDTVSYTADLSKYKIVIAPTIVLSDDEIADHLTSYVQSGGILLLGIHSGFKTLNNVMIDKPLPGPFRNLVGAVTDIGHALPSGVTYQLVDYKFRILEATVWAEGLSTEAAHPLMFYNEGPLEGKAAITVNAIGKGHVVYVGLWPNKAIINSIIDWLLQQANVQPLAHVPEGVLVYCRNDSKSNYLFLLNFNDVPSTAWIDMDNFSDVLTGQKVGRKVIIDPRDLKVLKGEVK